MRLNMPFKKTKKVLNYISPIVWNSPKKIEKISNKNVITETVVPTVCTSNNVSNSSRQGSIKKKRTYNSNYNDHLTNYNFHTIAKTNKPQFKKRIFSPQQQKSKYNGNIFQKKNELKLIPEIQINSRILPDKLKEIVASRRIKYSILLDEDRNKKIQKIMLIQRRWREYIAKHITSKVILLQKVFRVMLSRQKANKTHYKLLKLEKLLRTFVSRNSIKKINLYAKFKQYSRDLFKLFQQQNSYKDRFISNQTIQQEILFEIEAELKERKIENSLRIMFNIGDMKASKETIPGGIKTFPRHITETNVNRLSKRKIREILMKNTPEILIENENENEKVMETINTQAYSTIRPIIILTKVVCDTWNHFSCSKYSLIKKHLLLITVLQRKYRKHLLTKKFKFLNERMMIFFTLLTNTIMHNKLIYSFKRFLINKFKDNCSNRNNNLNYNSEYINKSKDEETGEVSIEVEKRKDRSIKLKTISDITIKIINSDQNQWNRMIGKIKDQILTDKFTSFS